MGSLFSALNIGTSGLQVAQLQLDTTSHNIANVNKEGYSRQRIDQETYFPNEFAFGFIGRGVKAGSVVRLRDIFLDRVYQRQSASLGFSEVRAGFFGQIEDIFLEPTDDGLSRSFNKFFDALQEFSTNVESLAIRQSVVIEAQSMADIFNDTIGRIDTLRTQANEEIEGQVPQINSLAERIAALNAHIRRLETSGNSANDLRDERGVLLDKLARLADINVSERQDGQVEVTVNSELLIDSDRVNYIEAVVNPALDPERNDLVELRFVASGRAFDPRSGEVAAALEMRDVTLVEVDLHMDDIARTIIEQINRIQSQAAGLDNYSGIITGSNAVTNPALALNTAGLPFTVTPGTFDIHVYDAAGLPVGGTPVTINVTGATTLNDIAAAITAVPNLTAVVDANNQLEITTAAGFTFSVFNDSTNVLTAVGVNGLFTGFDARTIGVNQDIANNVRLLASRYSTDPTETGDNTAALDLANVRNGSFLPEGTVNDAYEALIAQVGIDASANAGALNVEESFLGNINARREAVAGVSLDEEVTHLVQFQRAFEASARVITVTDRMLETLLSMAL